jgi:hypothetical protein
MLLSMTASAIPIPASISTGTTCCDPLYDHMPPTKRPKLSLQTTSLPSTTTYGIAASHNAGISRLAPDEISHATPTTLNTFTNTFDLSIRPSPISSAVASPSATLLSRPITAAPLGSRNAVALPSARAKRQLPYDLNLPFGVRPILKNSSLPLDCRRGSLGAISASPRSASSKRVFFPEPKRVKFGGQEEVVNRHYVARHHDLSSSEDDETSGSEHTAETDPVNAVDREEGVDHSDTKDASSGSSNLASKGGLVVDEFQRSSRRTNVTRKRRRWEWTLGSSPPSPGESGTALSSSTEEIKGSTIELDDAGKESVATITVDEIRPTPSPISATAVAKPSTGDIV